MTMSFIWLIAILIILGYCVYKFAHLLMAILKYYFSYSLAMRSMGPTPKDVVILHIPERGKCIPNPSPFALKVETYLRMAKIPYEVDHKFRFGPLGKSPWISFNGIHASDSECIIEFLNKEFKKDFSGHLTPEKKSMVQVIRIAAEEYHFWGGAIWRWITGFKYTSTMVMNINPAVLPVVSFIMPRRLKRDAIAQGIGRFPEAEIQRRTLDGLRRLSCLLGSDAFFAGEMPNEDDCGLFGQLAEIVYAMPFSPYEKLVKDELTNLASYCDRMKELYWQDWDKLSVNRY